MFKKVFDLVLKELQNNNTKDSTIENKIVKVIEEINQLEIKHAQALADVERWGDINDSSDWRTVEYNRIGRVIEAKKRMLDTLNNV